MDSTGSDLLLMDGERDLWAGGQRDDDEGESGGEERARADRGDRERGR